MPPQRDQHALYDSLRDPDERGIDAEPVEEIHALVRRVNDRPDVRACFAALAGLLGKDEEPLAEFLRLALLGVAVGFVERNLSPHLEQHRAIVPPLLDDIRGVYRKAIARHAPYDADEFRHRAYHYGVHKASYLDWDLYLSHEMY
ncbi:MAG: hypothetical protein HY342_03890 [Candidatus Lambdaproteobacteria bacterium]|nr:hypothetical protein [Candidatus Lambdaproteobacteria bacterium]